MANRPKNMTDAQWDAHLAASKREHDERARVDQDHTACILKLERQVAALEAQVRGLVTREKPAPKKKKS